MGHGITLQLLWKISFEIRDFSCWRRYLTTYGSHMTMGSAQYERDNIYLICKSNYWSHWPFKKTNWNRKKKRKTNTSQHVGPTWLWAPHNMRGIIYIQHVKDNYWSHWPLQKLIGLERRKGNQRLETKILYLLCFIYFISIMIRLETTTVSW